LQQSAKTKTLIINEKAIFWKKKGIFLKKYVVELGRNQKSSYICIVNGKTANKL